MPYKDPEKAREHARQWREANRERDNARKLQWQNAHPEYVLEKNRKYREKHREKYQESNRKWYAAHRETEKEKDRQYRAENPDKVHEKVRKWYVANRERWNEYGARRRAIQNGALSDLTEAEISEMKAAGCLFCGTRDDLTIAHDSPVSNRGNTTRGNCFCLCRACNSRMRTKTLAQTIKQLGFL